jgi:hypothetical protein
MISVERLQTYSPEDAAGIGRLMPFLSNKLSGEPISEERLQSIIGSHYHDLLIARDDNVRIVGTATLSIVMAAGTGERAYLEDFVTDPDTKGVDSALWEEMGNWCIERNVKLNFTSNPDRLAAHHFYASRATIRNTIVYSADFSKNVVLES